VLDKQIRESEQWVRTFERRQAEKIDFEPGSIGMTVPGLDPGEDSRAWRADVANGSPRPIRNIAGRIEAGPGGTPQQAALAASPAARSWSNAMISASRLLPLYW
jgi:hypothetical protein